MRAFGISARDGSSGWRTIPVPTPGAGEVLLRMRAAGLCRTDLEQMAHGEAFAQFKPWRGPFTLGHENAGTIVGLGPDVTGLDMGDAVLVSATSSCGTCRMCLAGNDAYCLDRPRSYGYRDDGGLAPYMVARRRDVVPIGDLDPALAAPLADAGATAYGAVLRTLPFIAHDGHVVVIGVGGVGGMAVQLLKLLTSATIIAVDLPTRLGHAAEIGADATVTSGPDALVQIKDLTHGAGAAAVIDVVGTVETLQLSTRAVATLGAVDVVGLSGQTIPFGFATQALGAHLFSSTSCSLGELRRLVELVRRGLLTVEHEAFAFDQVNKGYELLRSGQVRGRPVIIFEQ
jgi:propanol-preferring alcohol dehydrogenase